MNNKIYIFKSNQKTFKYHQTNNNLKNRRSVTSLIELKKQKKIGCCFVLYANFLCYMATQRAAWKSRRHEFIFSHNLKAKKLKKKKEKE